MNPRPALIALISLVAIAAVLLLARLNAPPLAPTLLQAEKQGATRCTQVRRAWRHHDSGLWIALSARVTRLLPDSYGRFTHQRFIVRCTSGMTILIVNDVSVGRRVPARVGDRVVVRGQYVWNSLGGLVHFTHHADSGPAGWIEDAGHIYAWTSFRTKSWKSAFFRARFVDVGNRQTSRLVV